MNAAKSAAVMLAIVIAVLGFTTGGGHAASPTPTSIEHRKAVVLKRIDERIAHLQDEKACFQAATSQDELKSCRDKFIAENRRGDQKPGRPRLNPVTP